MVIDRVCALLRSLTDKLPVLPPTLLYNEGWLLRLVLDWFSAHNEIGGHLGFPEGARWFSEALLPSAFPPRRRPDPHGETSSHADGVIGHFTIGSAGKANLALRTDSTCFVVLEAKMFSRLSAGVRNARGLNQAARSVACMAEVLRRAQRNPAAVTRLGFHVLAPRSQIGRGVFVEDLDRNLLLRQVESRVQNYEGDKDRWFQEWFQPTFQQVDISAVAWEDVIGTLAEHDKASGDDLREFYLRCVEFNS